MLEEQLIKVAKGLALIIPVILLLRWYLHKKAGSPEDWANYHIEELEKRYANGEIDEQTYQQRLKDLQES